MSGVPLVASATPPVLEFSGQAGARTIDFFDQAGFADALCDQSASNSSAVRRPLHMAQVELAHCVRQQLHLLTTL
ncbi:hypothetical protein D3C86_1852560 [compost metagenome]